MLRLVVLFGLLLPIAGCVTCPNEQELLDIGSEAQFSIGHLYIGFEANRDVLSESDQSAVQGIGGNLARQLRGPAYDKVFVYVAIGKYEGDVPGDQDLALRRFEHVEQLLRVGGLGSRKIAGVAELPMRDQLRRVEDGVYIGLRCD